MTLEELSVLVNGWPEGTQGNREDYHIIGILDCLGRGMGYGALEQLASWLFQIQCNKDSKAASDFKRLRFNQLGWNLPDNFEEVAARKPS